MRAKIIDPSEIDWEQRRYEIAKELYVRVVEYPNTYTAKLDSKTSVNFADALIEELKKPKEQDKFYELKDGDFKEVEL